MDFNSDFKYDLIRGQIAEKRLSDILSNKKIEVKRDFRALETGNLFIEYESRGKRSGIATSESEWYSFELSESRLITIESKELKAICRKYIGTSRDVCGGDNNSSKGILLPLIDIIKSK